VTFVLRKINKAKWYKHPGVEWLPDGEIQADALVDIRTMDNTLSVWQIDSNSDNLGRVVSALASMLDRVQEFDFVLLEPELLEKQGFQLIQSNGITPDMSVNVTWHYDIIELSVSKLYKFAQIINSQEHNRYSKNTVEQLIRNSCNSGNLDLGKINPKLKVKLGL
jgi:hypothetical protein